MIPKRVITRALLDAQDCGLSRIFVTQDNGPGPFWEYHPHKRWLIIRDAHYLNEGLAMALVAKSHWLGKGAATSANPPLKREHRQAFNAIMKRLYDDSLWLDDE